jgi:hypothetical protein
MTETPDATSAGLPQSDPPARDSETAGSFLAWCAVAFAVSFAVVWAYVAIMPMAFLGRDYPLWIAKRTLMDQCQLGSVLVFGDSRTLAATVPNVMPVSVTNLAQSGSSAIETYFSLRRALRCPTPPKLVVISHSAMKFMGDSDYWANFARNGVLDYAEMQQVGRDAAALHDREIIDLQPSDQLRPALRDTLFAVRFPPFYFGSLANGVVAARWHYNRQVLHDALLSAGHAVFGNHPGSSDLADEAHNAAYRASPLIDLYFSRILALLAERHIPAVFVSIPINHATWVRMSPAFSDRFRDYLQAKMQQSPPLRVVGPAIPCWPDRFFGDAWHLNAQGATEYSRWFGEVLRDELTGAPGPALPNTCPDAATGRAEPTVTLR